MVHKSIQRVLIAYQGPYRSFRHTNSSTFPWTHPLSRPATPGLSVVCATQQGSDGENNYCGLLWILGGRSWDIKNRCLPLPSGALQCSHHEALQINRRGPFKAVVGDPTGQPSGSQLQGLLYQATVGAIDGPLLRPPLDPLGRRCYLPHAKSSRSRHQKVATSRCAADCCSGLSEDRQSEFQS